MKAIRREHIISWWAICMMSALLLVAGCQSAPQLSQTDQNALKQLLSLIDQRLAVAPLVARSKWNSGGAIDDPIREKAILDTVTKQAEDAGLDPSFSRRFFQAQFDAGKLIQQHLHQQWRAEGQAKFDNAPDLGRDVRPVLDRLTPQLIAALRTVSPVLHRSGTDAFIKEENGKIIQGDGFESARILALQPLLNAAQGE